MTIRVGTERSVAQRAVMGAGWIIAWRVATRNIGLLSTLILVRMLQPTDFGLIALATGFINSVDALSAIGAQDALVRAPVLNRDMYDTGFGLSVLRGVVSALIIAAIAWPLGDFFGDMRLAFVMLALSAGTLVSAFENIGVIDFRRDLAFRKEFEMQLWSRILGATTTIAVAVVWRSYWALVAGILVYRLVRLLQSYIMSPYRPNLTIRAWRGLIVFSLWTWAQTILYQMRERIDGIIIGRLLGTAQVGVFSVGLELGSLPTTELVEPLCRALYSGFASLHNTSGNLGSMFIGAVGLGFALILPAGIGISMIADPMVRLCLGDNWLSAVPVVQILAIGAATAIFTQSCSNLLNAIGQPGTTFYVCGATTLVKLCAFGLLIPGYGLAGAAIATLISSIVDLSLLFCVTLPYIGVSMLQMAACVIRPSMATIVMVVILWQLGMAWTPSAGDSVRDYAADACLRSMSGAACYGVAMVAIWCACGRPDGPERFVLTMVKPVWQRIGEWSSRLLRM